jgi:hypothetical protein
MSAEWAAGGGEWALGGRYFRYRLGLTVNEIPSTLRPSQPSDRIHAARIASHNDTRVGPSQRARVLDRPRWRRPRRRCHTPWPPVVNPRREELDKFHR